MTEDRKKTDIPEPTVVTEEDIVEDESKGASHAAVPLAPRTESIEPSQAGQVEESVRDLFVAVFHGPLTRYIGISVLLHVAFIILFTLPTWLSSDEAKAEASKGTQSGQPAASAKADEKPETGKDPLSQTDARERAEKLLGHETAKPDEIPKKPNLDEIDELEALE